MTMTPKEIRETLGRLGNRSWPATWPPVDGDDDYFGWAHRYRLEPPLSEETVAAFEARHRVRLPHEYREFLVEVGNGGAGPHYGLFPLGTYEDRPLEPTVLQLLAEELDPDEAEAWDPDEEEVLDDDVMKGALIVATEGCALWYWLVVTGPNAGEIWFDPRAENEPPEPLADDEGPITFARWYETWLRACAAEYLR